jgi:hypothetical protein
MQADVLEPFCRFAVTLDKGEQGHVVTRFYAVKMGLENTTGALGLYGSGVGGVRIKG